MSKPAAAPAPDPEPHERRRLERKPTFLRAVIVDANTQDARNCLILDINAGGAQVSALMRYPKGTEVYLVDLAHQVAYAATLVWTKADRGGLCFTESHRIGMGLPLHWSFLWRLLLEAKLRDIERNIGNGISPASAFMNAGISALDLDMMTQRATGDAGFEQALHRARQLLQSDTH